MDRPHLHGDLELNFLWSGALTYLIGGGRVRIEAGRLCGFWGGAPHRLIGVEGEVRAGWATAPLSWVLSWSLPEGLLAVMMSGGVAAGPRDQGARDGELIEQWSTDLAGGAPGARRTVALEVEARVRRLMGDHPRVLMSAAGLGAAGRPIGGVEGVEAMARFIASRFAEPIDAAAIAAAAGLHPNYAMALFRRHTGLTLNAYLTMQRVAHAQRLLATTGRPVLAIGFDSGFGSVSRYYEAFKRQTGRSPAAYRRALRGRGVS